jgi:FtsZ-binding cell division protein ZapB
MPVTTCKFSAASYQFIAASHVPELASSAPLSLTVACMGPNTGALYEGHLEAKALCEQCPMFAVMPGLLAEFMGYHASHSSKLDRGAIEVTFELGIGSQKLKLIVELENAKNKRKFECDTIVAKWAKKWKDLDDKNTHAANKIAELSREISQLKEKASQDHNEASQKQEVLDSEIVQLKLELDQVRAEAARKQADLVDEIARLGRAAAEECGDVPQAEQTGNGHSTEKPAKRGRRTMLPSNEC